jgi:hypothetical protein
MRPKPMVEIGGRPILLHPGFREVRHGSSALPSRGRALSLGESAARCSSRFLGYYFQACTTAR